GANARGAAIANFHQPRAGIGDRAPVDAVADLEEEHDGERRDRQQRRREDDGKQPQAQAGAFARHESSRNISPFQPDTRRSPKNRYSSAPRARNGPYGTACFGGTQSSSGETGAGSAGGAAPRSRRTASKRLPTTAPWTAERSTTGSRAGQPSQAPIPARSQTSPQPMVSRLSTFSPNRATAANAAKPATAPMPASRKERTGFQIGESAPATRSGQVIWWGKSQVSRSMYESATSVAANAK